MHVMSWQQHVQIQRQSHHKPKQMNSSIWKKQEKKVRLRVRERETKQAFSLVDSLFFDGLFYYFFGCVFISYLLFYLFYYYYSNRSFGGGFSLSGSLECTLSLSLSSAHFQIRIPTNVCDTVDCMLSRIQNQNHYTDRPKMNEKYENTKNQEDAGTATKKVAALILFRLASNSPRKWGKKNKEKDAENGWSAIFHKRHFVFFSSSHCCLVVRPCACVCSVCALFSIIIFIGVVVVRRRWSFHHSSRSHFIVMSSDLAAFRWQHTKTHEKGQKWMEYRSPLSITSFVH